MAQLTQSQKEHALANRLKTATPPKNPARGFLRDAHPAKRPQAQTPPVPEKRPYQIPLKRCLEHAKHELERIYRQGQPKRQHTLAEQVVFVQSYRSVGELLQVFYAQATGQIARETEQQLQQRYAQAMELLQLFYQQADQPPDAWKVSRQLFFDVYVRAQGSEPHPANTQMPPKASQPGTSGVQQPPSIVPSKAPLVKPTASGVSSSNDQTHCRPWSQEEFRKVQQAQEASAPKSRTLHGESPQQAEASHVVQPLPPAKIPAMITASNGKPLPGEVVHPNQRVQRSEAYAPATQTNHVSTEDSRSQQRYQRQSWDPRVSRREYLLRERTRLEREVERVLGQGDALNQQWQFLDERKAKLTQDKALVPVKETISFVVRRLIRLPLPSAARQVSYAQERLRQEEAWLHKQTAIVTSSYHTLLREIQIIDTELSML